MILQEVVKSKLDRTHKFLFTNDKRQVMEISYIDHTNDKDSLCVPTQSACSMACKFCHTSDVIGQINTSNFEAKEICEGVMTTYDALKLADNPKVLLVSFMGCGEPMENTQGVLDAMYLLTNIYRERVPLIRYGMATMLPKCSAGTFVKFAEEVRKHSIPLKVHLSLHFTQDELRRKWMPRAEAIKPSLNLLEWYKNYTGNSVEVHYTLIEGVNDTKEDAIRLSQLLEGRGIPVKLLKFNPKPEQPYQPSPGDWAQEFGELVSDESPVTVECYTPPGVDIGASCGQFMMDYYVKYANESLTQVGVSK